jgi:hypothetical protein
MPTPDFVVRLAFNGSLRMEFADADAFASTDARDLFAHAFSEVLLNSGKTRPPNPNAITLSRRRKKTISR